MPRSVTTYVCQNCGAQTRQFFGRCSACGSWNSLVEQSSGPPPDARRRREPSAVAAPAPRRSEAIAHLGEREVQRLHTGFAELDRVLGGGLVPGSLVLVG